jgi:phosphoglycolate phosphatase
MLKAIVFDFDGVIADTFDLSVRIIRKNGKRVTRKQYRDHHNGNVWEEPAVYFSKEERRNFHDRRMESASAEHLFPIVGEIRRLSRKNILLIISSSADDIVRKYLSLGKIGKYFTEVLGRRIHLSKVEKFKMIFKKYKIRPEECVFVTDTLGDLREAKIVGVPTIAVTWGYHGKIRLKKGKPDMIIHDFEELAGAINRMKQAK